MTLCLFAYFCLSCLWSIAASSNRLFNVLWWFKRGRFFFSLGFWKFSDIFKKLLGLLFGRADLPPILTAFSSLDGAQYISVLDFVPLCLRSSEIYRLFPMSYCQNIWCQNCFESLRATSHHRPSSCSRCTYQQSTAHITESEPASLTAAWLMLAMLSNVKVNNSPSCCELVSRLLCKHYTRERESFSFLHLFRDSISLFFFGKAAPRLFFSFISAASISTSHFWSTTFSSRLTDFLLF